MIKWEIVNVLNLIWVKDSTKTACWILSILTTALVMGTLFSISTLRSLEYFWRLQYNSRAVWWQLSSTYDGWLRKTSAALTVSCTDDVSSLNGWSRCPSPDWSSFSRELTVISWLPHFSSNVQDANWFKSSKLKCRIELWYQKVENIEL